MQVEAPTSNGTIGASALRPSSDGEKPSNLERPPRRRLILYHPDDRQYLTELVCLVRKQIELFVEDTGVDYDCGDPRSSGQQYVEGRVGIRCIHCATPNEGGAGAATPRARKKPLRGAVLYPTSTRLVEQSVRNYQRYHMLNCPSMPQDVRSRIEALKSAAARKRSSCQSEVYRKTSCARMGLIDTPFGLRLIRAALDGTWTEEMGKAAVARSQTTDGIRLKQPQDIVKQATMGPLGINAAEQVQLRGSKRPSDVSDIEDAAVNYEETCANDSGLATTAGKLVPASTGSNIDISVSPSGGATYPVEGNCDDQPRKSVPMGETLEQSKVSENGDGTHTEVLPGLDSGVEVDHLPLQQADLPPSNDGASYVKDRGKESSHEAPFHQNNEILHQHDEDELTPSDPLSPSVEPLNEEDSSLLPAGRNPVLSSDTAKEWPSFLEEIPASSVNIFQQERSDSTALQATSLSIEMVLRRVELACSIVQASMEIRHLPHAGNNENHSPESGCASADELHHLGKELYELFSDRRPFEMDEAGEGRTNVSIEGTLLAFNGSEDYASVRQCHMKRGRPLEGAGTQNFVPLTELGLPPALCLLVSSLLEANTGRYKSYGDYSTLKDVQDDLQFMANYPEKYLNPHAGTMGFAELQLFDIQQDVLYGREKELSKLRDVYNHVTSPSRTDGRSSMVLISGYSGTGKSSLVRKVGREYIQRGARFVSGKFDAMQQTQPLSAIMSALNDYCSLLADDASQLDNVQAAVAAALGGEGRGVLIDLIPNLRKILPARENSPSSPELLGQRTQQCLSFFVRMLLRVTCSREKPIVIFLDDVQWADSSSLQLMQSFVVDSMLDNLLCVVCYRENEVGPGHPLLECLNCIQRFGSSNVLSICTSNLDSASVNYLISNALHMLPRATKSLSEAVLRKTSGNALFVEQLLASLRDEGLLQYSLSTRKWQWDIDSIQAREVANNVVDLMRAKLLRLDPNVRESLLIAAAFGRQCLEDVLQILDRDPCRLGSTVAALDVAVAEGLMVKVEGPAYRFSHDQIQSAAYMLIPELERESFHLQIGRSLWQQSSEEEMETYLFAVVDQLHRGAGYISDHNEKIRLVNLSLVAGQKAAGMSAFLPASAYLKAGIDLIAEDDWEWHRELCLDLYNLCAEMEFLIGKFDGIISHLDNVILRSVTLREKIRVYYTLIRSSGAQKNTADAFSTAIMVLGQLRETVPSELTQLDVQQELVTTQEALSTKTENDLRELKTMTDIEKLEAMRFYSLLLLYSYAEKQMYFPVIACRMLRLSLSYGVCRKSATAFVAYGMTVCGLLGDAGGAYRLGKVALAFVDRFEGKECLPQVNVAVYGFINDWIDPIQSSIPFLKSTVDAALSVGDNESAMLSANLYQGTCLASGKPLGPLMDEMNKYANQMLELNQNFVYSLNQPLRQFSLNLLGKSADPVKLVGEAMDEENLLGLLEERSSALRSIIYFYRMWLEYLFGEYERAAEAAAKNSNIHKDHMGRFVMIGNHAFFSGLAALALARKEGRGKWELTIKTTMTQMRKWAASNPWNCQHKVELMYAEYAYLEGDTEAAITAYDRAVATAAKHRFVNEEALALERAGIFYMENSDFATASSYFAKARNCYAQWEAHSKVDHVSRYI